MGCLFPEIGTLANSILLFCRSVFGASISSLRSPAGGKGSGRSKLGVGCSFISSSVSNSSFTISFLTPSSNLGFVTIGSISFIFLGSFLCNTSAAARRRAKLFKVNKIGRKSPSRFLFNCCNL